MRLLQITASNVWRGHEQQIVYYYEAFNDQLEHQVLLCPEGTRLAEIAVERNFNAHILPNKSEYDLSWSKKIKDIVKKEKIDLILIHNSTAHTLCVFSSVLFNLKTPMIFFRTLIKRVDTNPFRKWKYNYKHLRKLVCVSEAVIESLKPAIEDHSRFSVVGSATDLEEFHHRKKTHVLRKQLGLPEDTVLIANISAFVGFKDHYTFLNTAKILAPKLPNVKFLLIGTGSLEDEMKTYAKEIDVENEVLFLGFRRDIPEIFPDFDLFLFTSKSEPTGGVLLEAYASHVPIVAARAGGIPEVIVDGKTGILCEKENPEDFAKAVLELLNNPTRQKELTVAGFKHLKQNFTKKVIAEKMLEELSETHRKFN